MPAGTVDPITPPTGVFAAGSITELLSGGRERPWRRGGSTRLHPALRAAGICGRAWRISATGRGSGLPTRARLCAPVGDAAQEAVARRPHRWHRGPWDAAGAVERNTLRNGRCGIRSVQVACRLDGAWAMPSQSRAVRNAPARVSIAGGCMYACLAARTSSSLFCVRGNAPGHRTSKGLKVIWRRAPIFGHRWR